MNYYNILNDNTGEFICREKPGTEDQELSDSYAEWEVVELLKDNPHYIIYPSVTPLKDAWTERLTVFDQTNRFEGSQGLEKGFYAYIKTPTCQYFGIIKSVGSVNVILETPYQPRPGDFNCIQELKFKKQLVHLFIKPKKVI